MSQVLRAAQRALRTGGGLNAATPFAARQQVRGMGERMRSCTVRLHAQEIWGLLCAA